MERVQSRSAGISHCWIKTMASLCEEKKEGMKHIRSAKSFEMKK